MLGKVSIVKKLNDSCGAFVTTFRLLGRLDGLMGLDGALRRPVAGRGIWGRVDESEENLVPGTGRNS